MKRLMAFCTVLLFSLLLFPGLASASDPEWTNYTDGSSAVCLSAEKDFLWVGTTGGLVRVDKGTLETVFYNRSNSGILDNRVSCLAVDSSGNKWVGTARGLCRFNGAEWTAFDESNSTLTEDPVGGLAVDGDGAVWVAAGNGLSRFDGTGWTRDDGPNGGGLSDVQCMTIDRSGNKWIGLFEQALVRFDGTEWEITTPSDSGLPDYYIWSLAVDDTNALWIGTMGGLARRDGNSWAVYDTTNSGLPYNAVYAVTPDPSGGIWAGTYEGLGYFDGNRWTVYDASNSGLPVDIINSVLPEDAGGLWVGTTGGLVKKEGSEWTRCGTSNSGLLYFDIHSVAVDRSGGKWIGTYGYGLTHFDGSEWETILPSFTAWASIGAIAIDRFDVKWMKIVGNGLARYKSGQWTSYTTLNSGIPDNWVNAVFPNDSGGVWVGTGKGLARFDGNDWAVVNVGIPDDFTSNHVFSIARVDSGRMWFGTEGRILKTDGTRWWQSVLEIPGCPWCANRVNHILFDEKTGVKWVAAPYTLFRIDDTGQTVYPSHELTGANDNDIEALALDGKGSVWMGTRFGLGHLGADGWSVYTTANSGLPDDWVRSLAVDSSGAVWIGTMSGGLAVFRGAGVNAVQPEEFSGGAGSAEDFALAGNYPNPFNSGTMITYRVPSDGRVLLDVYGADGRFVRRLADERHPAGFHSVHWDGTDREGTPVPSGIYIVWITGDGGWGFAGRMVLLR